MTSPEDRNPYAPPGGQTPAGWGPPPAAGQGWGGSPPAAPDWGGAPGYGQAGGGGRPPETEPKAIIALVLAIASFVVLPVLPAIAALFVARAAVRDIDAEPMRLTGRGLATGARITAWVNIGLSILALLLVVLAFGFLFSVGSDSTVFVESGEFTS